jgi:hypothetical protein
MVQKMLFVGIILVAVQALAAPVHLACTHIDKKGSNTSVTIDESAHQAFIGTNDPAIAAFTETSVKWTTTWTDESGLGKSDFVLDRVTGVLTISTSMNKDDYYSRFAEYSCAVAEKKF